MQNNYNGVININKSPGLTSFGVVAQVKRLLKVKKAGHTGTLDPIASGVLPICLGPATKIAQFLLEADKGYRFTAKLGVTTNTQDAAGEIIETRDISTVTREKIVEACRNFEGEIYQTPPMYSAIKFQGQRLYELARRGEEVERQPRRVSIYKFELLDFQPPLAKFDLLCSKGTYVRTICADLGESLGCGAHLYQLIRTKSGRFTIEDALTLDELAELYRQGRLAGKIYSMEQVLDHLPPVIIGKSAVSRILQGMPLFSKDILYPPAADIKPKDKVRLHAPSGQLIAVGVARIDYTPASQLPSTVPLFQPYKLLIGNSA